MGSDGILAEYIARLLAQNVRLKHLVSHRKFWARIVLEPPSCGRCTAKLQQANRLIGRPSIEDVARPIVSGYLTSLWQSPLVAKPALILGLGQEDNFRFV
ncbi:hypothetical protein BDV09DRAFT_189974 [Aspergillus tetrazonus]